MKVTMMYRNKKVLFGVSVLLLAVLGTVSYEWQSQTKENLDYLPHPLDTQIFGQNSWLAKSKIVLKVVAMNRQNRKPVKSNLLVKLISERGKQIVFEGMTDENGVADLQFQAPSKQGNYTLSVELQSPIGQDKIEQSVTVKEEAQILISTDKPIYQPTQKIHIRALCLFKPDLKPASNLPLTFEIIDPKGNKVFEVTVPTSRFGIAATEFPIADEVTLGEYIIRANLKPYSQPKNQKEGSTVETLSTVERTVRIERYVLPKFKVEVETEKKFYLPGETLRGTLTANYFFGKPVSRGEAKVKLSTFAAGWQDIAELSGILDDKGIWQFETKLPDKFVGLPLEGGNAILRLQATVTDKADHSDSSSTTLPVSNEPIKISVVPESAELKPNLPMRLFVVTTYPDGTPAKCKFNVKGIDVEFEGNGQTDETGVGELTVNITDYHIKKFKRKVSGRWIKGAPVWEEKLQAVAMPPMFDERMPAKMIQVFVTADDATGNHAEIRQKMSLPLTDESILLRTDKSIAKVGDELQISIFTTKPSNSYPTTVFVDVIVNKQTILTKTVELDKGRGNLSLPLTSDISGTLVLHAYRITSGGDILRDTKIVFVEPANELKVKVHADKENYRPGEQAQMNFVVTDRNGKPVITALGLTVVDESVFALAQEHPGLERLYFALEQDLLTPRYEVHGWELKPILLHREIDHDRKILNDQSQRIASILFAAVTPTQTHTLHISTYEKKKEAVMGKWFQFVSESFEKIRKALEAYRHAKGSYPSLDSPLHKLVAEKFLTNSDIRDPLGNLYRLQAFGNDLKYGFALISGGLDGKMNTPDDIVIHPNVFLQRGGEIFADGELKFAMMRKPGAPVVEKFREISEATPQFISTASPTEEVRVRQFFPETLFVNPQVITNEDGKAILQIPLADSITTWRLTALANSLTGQLGSETASIRVFQDFFVDIDLPVALTQGDEVSIPVAIYNYLAKPQRVKLKLDVGNGFEVLDETEKIVSLEPNEVTSVRFRLKASKLGSHQITAFAYGDAMSDAIKRTVTVLPDGKEIWQTLSDQLTVTNGKQKKVKTLKIITPKEAIDKANTLLVKVHPCSFTQVLDGLENLLRMPFGCFEQTSSITYPNVLVLNYLKRTGKTMTETRMKASHFITIGYQRLLTFEVQGGGFSWFGEAPAHKVLTAYGLLEFSDMSKVHNVDLEVIRRTVNWLIDRQSSDGSWEPDKGGIAEGAINRQTDLLRTTAYITWSITEATERLKQNDKAVWKNAIQKAVGYLSENAHKADDPYALALVLNAFIGAKGLGVQISVDQINRTAQRLANLAKERDDFAFWETGSKTPFYGHGKSGDLETTALSAYALLRHGSYAPLVNKALTYLVRNKDEFGTWQTTQATIWSLKAFIDALEHGSGAANGSLTVKVNDIKASEWEITPENSNIVRQIDVSQWAKEGINELTLEFEGEGGLMYQVSNRFYLPWELVTPLEEEPLQVQISYDRTQLQTNETITCHVRVYNRRNESAQMVIVDIGTPPGFEVLTDDLTEAVSKNILQKFELTPRQIICYLDHIKGGKTTQWQFRLRAKMPVKVKTGRTVAYEYYAPQQRSIVEPKLLKAK